MGAPRRCPGCGWEGDADELTQGFEVCARCGEALTDPADVVLTQRRFRLGKRSALRPGRPTQILDGGGTELAHVQRGYPGPRRFFALLAGALTVAGGLVGLYALAGAWGWWGQALVLASGLPLLLLGLRIVARLSPGPSLIVVRSGRDPRLLFSVRPVREEGSRSALEVDDANGTRIGELSLDRARSKARPHEALEGYVEIIARDGSKVRARRVSRIRPGAVYEDERGDAVATHGLSGGWAWDELQVSDAAEIDPRLLLAAALVSAP